MLKTASRAAAARPRSAHEWNELPARALAVYQAERRAATMADNTDFHAHLAALQRDRAHVLEQIRVSVETVEQSRELLRQMDELLAKSPLQLVARS
jgi:hypothetical protein